MEFFKSSNALESLRSSDFDNMSAYAEVIDNSLQAGAKNINVDFFSLQVKANYERIDEIAFGDDGTGMDTDTLHACLQLGWSSRYNDRSGIGRFGVGMVLGGIHECQCIEVYSNNGQGWHYTYVDLQEIEADTLNEIPAPVLKSVPSKFEHLINKNRGTLVVWSKHDRQPKSSHLIVEDVRHYFGRTFRKFIWEDDVQIQINSTPVKAFDPLYARTEKTKFPEDPKAKLYEPMKFNWNIPDAEHQRGTIPHSEVTIRMSLLPEEFRPKVGSGGSAENRARMIHQNSGISILRNRREVFYGQTPRWNQVRLNKRPNDTWPFEEIDRWWGCEIEFDATLDQCFQVKNIKRGAEPVTELKETIKALIGPTRDTVLAEVRRVWSDARQEKIKEESDRPHSVAEKAVKRANTPASLRNAGTTIAQTSKQLGEGALRDLEETERAKYQALFAAQPFTIQEDRWRGGTFWEIVHGGGHALISYNTDHSFFKQYYELVGQIDGDDELSIKLKTLIDLLLIASAKAQSMYDSSDMPIDRFNDQWGMYLESYVKSWRENEND